MEDKNFGFDSEVQVGPEGSTESFLEWRQPAALLPPVGLGTAPPNVPGMTCFR